MSTPKCGNLTGNSHTKRIRPQGSDFVVWFGAPLDAHEVRNRRQSGIRNFRASMSVADGNYFGDEFVDDLLSSSCRRMWCMATISREKLKW